MSSGFEGSGKVRVWSPGAVVGVWYIFCCSSGLVPAFVEDLIVFLLDLIYFI